MTKPPFRLPSMADVNAATGTSGLKVVSTFTGCGGSCAGFQDGRVQGDLGVGVHRGCARRIMAALDEAGYAVECRISKSHVHAQFSDPTKFYRGEPVRLYGRMET